MKHETKITSKAIEASATIEMPRLRATNIRREAYPGEPKAAKMYRFDIIDVLGRPVIEVHAEPCASGVMAHYGWEARQTHHGDNSFGWISSRHLHRAT